MTSTDAAVLPRAPAQNDRHLHQRHHRVRFGPVEIAYDGGVLAPREWTLAQSRLAADLAPSLPDGPVLELCCGAGQIGLAVAAWTGRPLVQVDDDRRACAWAARNARANGIEAATVCMPVERLFLAASPLVLADPPYLGSGAAASTSDPGHAVDGGRDGLALVRATVRAAARHLDPAGVVVLQLGGEEQADVVARDIAPQVGLRVESTHGFGPDRALTVLHRA